VFLDAFLGLNGSFGNCSTNGCESFFNEFSKGLAGGSGRSTMSCQPWGGGCAPGGGVQPSGGSHPSGGVGQPGGLFHILATITPFT